MKLNATTEMVAITWPEFAQLHPFAPHDQTEGIRGLVDELSGWLCEITGYDAVSLQPNAGSQGELAGLLAIAAYHRSRGDDQRTVCLIPTSAHGTNAASAVMAGLRVVVVKTDPVTGNVDMDDLKAKVEEHRDTLAAIMVTYPSTHGVFEDTITDLCAMVHDAGRPGLRRRRQPQRPRRASPGPGRFGADVSHLNLHKTFCIPHGGGGPGVGPVGVREHLAPFLPNHPLDPAAGPETGVGPISARALRLGEHPADLVGLRAAHGRRRPAPRDRGGRAQRQLRRGPAARALPGALLGQRRPRRPRVHPRPARHHQGHRRHASTTSPSGSSTTASTRRRCPSRSPGTLMVEPTESEDKGELDRFCDAMIAIRARDRRGRLGCGRGGARACCAARRTPRRRWPASGTTPTTARTAAFPEGVDPTAKYWPPVRRIDGAYGDRHLVCSCPPPEAFED